MDKRKEAAILVEFQGMKLYYVCFIRRRILKSARQGVNKMRHYYHDESSMDVKFNKFNLLTR